MNHKAMGTIVAALLLAAGGACGDDGDVAQIETKDAGDGGSQEPSPGDTTDSTAPGEGAGTEGEPPALLLIMDSSGSMNQPGGGGQTRIEGAKQALRDVVGGLPEGQHVGLRVYGHRYPNTDKENGCRDSELIHPVEPLNSSALLDAIDGYQAKGFTPIGLSLREGAKDLPPEGARTMVLVSDGEETCDTDPCAAAEQVASEGIELVIHTVGFALGDNEQARSELECIAEAGDGTFVDVEDAGDLAGAIEDVAREERGFNPTGGSLKGAPTPREAATGEPNSSYTDTVLGEEVNFYRFEVTPGSEVVGELTRLGNPNEGGYQCALVSVTDAVGEELATGGEPGGTYDASETLVWGTDSAVVDDEEVWLKVETRGCGGHQGKFPDSQFEVEVRLTVDG